MAAFAKRLTWPRLRKPLSFIFLPTRGFRFHEQISLAALRHICSYRSSFRQKLFCWCSFLAWPKKNQKSSRLTNK